MKKNRAKLIGCLVLLLLAYMASYPFFRKTRLGADVYVATEDVYMGVGSLNQPDRIKFKSSVQVLVAYLYFPLSTIDYHMHGHAYIY